MKIPYCSNLKNLFILWYDINDAKTLEPSKGGIGIRLKKARNKFILIVFKNILSITLKKGLNNNEGIKNFNIPTKIPNKLPAIKAKSKLDIGPASETYLIPFL